MHSHDTLKMQAGRVLQIEQIERMTPEELLKDLTDHERAAERVMASASNIDPDEHFKRLAETRRKRLLERLEREWRGESDES